jgi:LysM repeat protein
MKKYAMLPLLFFSIVCLLGQHHEAYASSTSNIYEVKRGDTLPKIAKQFNTSSYELKVTNGLQSNALIEGQKLVVPVIHEVGSGETLQKIAKDFRSTEGIIQKANNLSSNHIHPGQTLTIKPKPLNMEGQHILMSREEFKDWLLNQKFSREIQLIQQHHTWQPSYKHFHGNNHFQMLNSMQHHHMKTMGWSNIAQNITTFPDGKIALSRPINVSPEGTIGPKANKNGIAIEHIGNFDIGHDVMTKEQQETIVFVTALLSLKFGLDPSVDTITYHHWWHYKTKERVLDNAKDYEVKSCPGTNFFGGNSTTSAKKNFYPLVKEKMEELRELFE